MQHQNIIFFVAFFSLFGASFCQTEKSDKEQNYITLHLTGVSHADQVYLNVTFHTKLLKPPFKETTLVCFQNNNQSMEKGKRVALRRLKKREFYGLETYIYKLLVQQEGFLQCVYFNQGKSIASSNMLFIRFGNIHVSVAKLNTRISTRQLQDILDDNKNSSNADNFMARQISADKSVFHVNSKYFSRDPTSDTEILKRLQRTIKQNIKPPLALLEVRSTRFCPAIEEYEIPFTNFGNVASFGQNMLIKCEGNFYTGAFWNEEGLKKLESSKLGKLNSVFGDQNDTFTNIGDIQNFADRLKNASTVSEQELPIIANKFEKLVMDEAGILRGAKSKQNTSNELLAKLDSVLVNTTLVSGFAQEVRPNFAARVEDIKETGSVGLMIMAVKNTTGEDDGNQTLIPLSAGTQNKDVVDSSPKVGIRLPDSLLDAWDTPQRLVVSVFADAKSFFDSGVDTSSVVSATLGGVHRANLEEPVVLWFKRNADVSPEPGICVFWDFLAAEEKGAWSREGCELHATHYLNGSFYLDECHCWHMTHFGELLIDSNDPYFKSFSDDDRVTLETISKVGCIVSLIALCAVFLTATFNKHWLKGPGQKILLQMSVSLALLLIIFLVATEVETNRVGCFFVGFFLHYSILSNFFWMAVAGYLQYLRLVKVIYTRTPKLIFKAAVIGWGVPVIPGALVLISNQFRVYSGGTLCIPSGWAFYVTILAPLSLILLLNLVIFLKIFQSIFTLKMPRKHVDKCISIRRFKQLAFLFTLLGLNWTFGVCQVAFPKARIVFAYLFCFTVAFQGLAYFVFFVLMHDKARNSWRALLCGGKLMFKVEWGSEGKEDAANTESSSMAK